MIEKLSELLEIVLKHLMKVRDYFSAKRDTDSEHTQQPLFKDMNHPKQEQVGVL